MRKESGTGPEQEKAVSKDLEKRLEGYALAAAAGLGVLALAMPAEATIISSSENIVVNGSHPSDTLAIPGGPTLNFHFSAYSLSHPFGGESITANILRAPGYILLRDFGGVQPLPAGFQLSANFNSGSDRWAAGSILAGGPRPYRFGYFTAYGRPGFLGFKSGGRVGWAAVDVTGSISANNLAAHITGYAFDTVPGQSITVGAAAASEPSTPTLVLLALGALGLAALRKRNSQAKDGRSA
jgi:hypothetical protein